MGRKIVIVGGVAAGAKAAAKARREDPEAEITVITEESDVSYAGCGLPYYVGGVIPDRGMLVVRTAEEFRSESDIQVVTGRRAVEIRRGAREVVVIDAMSGEEEVYQYDALILATGASPIVPDLPGIRSQGILTLRRVRDADAIRSFVTSRRPGSAVVVGGGFVGLESAENLALLGMDVTIIEMMEDFPPGFDPEVCRHIANHLMEKRVGVLSGTKVLSFDADPDGFVRAVRTSRGTVSAEIVLWAGGVRPNTSVAKEAGIRLLENGAVAVNEWMRTSDPHVFAVGDCAGSVNLVTGRSAWYPLGSTANKMGRIAGAVSTGVTSDRPPTGQFLKGLLGTSVFKVFDLNCARTGLSETEARREGFDVVTSTVQAPDRAHYYPGHRDIIVKLIADKRTRRVLGAQVIGEGVVDKPIDTVVTLVTLGGTVDDLATLDLAYAPPFSSAMSPVIVAANVLLNKMDGKLQGITAAELKRRMDESSATVGGGPFILDVRTEPEFITRSIPGAVNIPLSELRSRLHEVPNDRDIVVVCKVGRRAYLAYAALKRRGFGSVRILDGGMTAWPYETT